MGDRRRYSDRRDYLIEAVRKRRKKVREMALDFLGGKCTRCVTIDALTRSKFITSNPTKRTSAFRHADIPEVGKPFGRS
jgi:hypothetical protein